MSGKCNNHVVTYAENVLHSGVSLSAQDAPVGVESVDELLGGHHGEGVLQQRDGGKDFSLVCLFFFFGLETVIERV